MDASSPGSGAFRPSCAARIARMMRVGRGSSKVERTPVFSFHSSHSKKVMIIRIELLRNRHASRKVRVPSDELLCRRLRSWRDPCATTIPSAFCP